MLRSSKLEIRFAVISAAMIMLTGTCASDVLWNEDFSAASVNTSFTEFTQGSATGGDSELIVTLAVYSANISGYTLAFGAFNLGTVVEKTVVTLDSFSVEATKRWVRSCGGELL